MNLFQGSGVIVNKQMCVYPFEILGANRYLLLSQKVHRDLFRLILHAVTKDVAALIPHSDCMSTWEQDVMPFGSHDLAWSMVKLYWSEDNMETGRGSMKKASPVQCVGSCWVCGIRLLSDHKVLCARGDESWSHHTSYQSFHISSIFLWFLSTSLSLHCPKSPPTWKTQLSLLLCQCTPRIPEFFSFSFFAIWHISSDESRLGYLFTRRDKDGYRPNRRVKKRESN